MQGAGYELGLEQRRFQLGCDGFRCLHGVSTAGTVDESGSATSMSSAFISLRLKISKTLPRLARGSKRVSARSCISSLWTPLKEPYTASDSECGAAVCEEDAGFGGGGGYWYLQNFS